MTNLELEINERECLSQELSDFKTGSWVNFDECVFKKCCKKYKKKGKSHCKNCPRR